MYRNVREKWLDAFGIPHIDGKSMCECTVEELVAAHTLLWGLNPMWTRHLKRVAVAAELRYRGYEYDGANWHKDGKREQSSAPDAKSV